MPTAMDYQRPRLDEARIRAEARRLVREFGLAPHNALTKAAAKAKRKGWYSA